MESRPYTFQEFLDDYDAINASQTVTEKTPRESLLPTVRAFFAGRYPPEEVDWRMELYVRIAGAMSRYHETWARMGLVEQPDPDGLAYPRQSLLFALHHLVVKEGVREISTTDVERAAQLFHQRN